MKETNKSKGRTLIALLLETYREYVDNGYPKDPSVYVIRAHPETRENLLKTSGTIFYRVKGIELSNSEERFMGFTVLTDKGLAKEDLRFGPDTVLIKWRD